MNERESRGCFDEMDRRKKCPLWMGWWPCQGACGEDEVETVDKTTDGTRASRAALCHFPTVGLLFVSIAFYECGSTTFGFLSL